MEWISVKDRMPEIKKCVMIFSKDGGVAEGCYNDEYGIDCFEQWRWNCKQHEVTHWMPLPRDPK